MTHVSRDTSGDAILIRTISGFTCLLILSTWQLWIGNPNFPQVPLWSGAIHWPRWVDHVSVVSLLGSLTVAVVAPGKTSLYRISLVVALSSLLALWVTDQHRIQPWAYHFALSAWILLVCPGPLNRRWLRAVILSVYLFSALSKIDARFLETHGAAFVQAALELIGIGAQGIAPPTRARLAIGLPIGELLTFWLLAIPRLRPIGCGAAVFLHLSLIGLLGPWAMNHRWGVLVWNVAFLTQVLILFKASPRAERQPGAPRPWWPPSAYSRIGLIPILAALLLPALEPLKVWDAWLSWGLYSTRAPKLDVYLTRSATEQLPSSIRAFCQSIDGDAIWTRLATDRWALDTLQAPNYPHPRVQLGMALAVVGLLPDEERHVMAEWTSAPDRRTGDTTTVRESGEASLERRTATFRWNARPREPFTPGK